MACTYYVHVQGHDGFSMAGVSEIHTQELAAKISETEKLHMKVRVLCICLHACVRACDVGESTLGW